MQQAKKGRAYFGVARLLLLSLVFTLIAPSTVFAQTNSVVRAEVCDSTSPPDVTIQSPVSDSIVDSQPITVSGTTVRTSQIDVFVNNSYSSSVGVDDTQVFSFSVSLNKGTNTIRLHAVYSCNNTTADKSVVVSYEPSSSPGTGDDTSTVTTSPSSIGPGIVSNPKLSASGLGLAQQQALDVGRLTAKRKLFRALGFDKPDGVNWEYNIGWGVFLRLICLLLAMALFIISLLPKKWLLWLRKHCGFEKYLMFMTRRILLIAALLLLILFVILVLT